MEGGFDLTPRAEEGKWPQEETGLSQKGLQLLLFGLTVSSFRVSLG